MNMKGPSLALCYYRFLPESVCVSACFLLYLCDRSLSVKTIEVVFFLQLSYFHVVQVHTWWIHTLLSLPNYVIIFSHVPVNAPSILLFGLCLSFSATVPIKAILHEHTPKSKKQIVFFYVWLSHVAHCNCFKIIWLLLILLPLLLQKLDIRQCSRNL